MFRFLSAVAAVIFVPGAPVWAQAEQAEFLVELNKATERNGACEIVIFARNGLGQGLSEMSLKFAVVDAAGQFNSMLSLPLGAMRNNDGKFASYTLKMSCDNLSKVVINDIVSCTLKGAGEQSDLCVDRLEVNSREPEIKMEL